MTQPVGSPLTPATVGGTMAQQNADSVHITGGYINPTSGFVNQIVTVAGATGNITGNLIYCPDGDGGSPCLAVYDGSSYKRIALGATIST